MTDANSAISIRRRKIRNRSSIIINTTNDAYKSAFYHFVRYCHHLKNNIMNSFYPIRLSSGFYFVTIFFMINVFVFDMSFGNMSMIQYFIKDFRIEARREFILINVIFSFLVWFIISTIHRLTLRLLLHYQGWLYDPVGRPSYLTKVYMFTLMTLIRSTPNLYSYQSLLPHLPIPKLKDTINLYLKSVEPILDKPEYDRLEKMALNFKSKYGMSIQVFLYFRYLFTPNYVTYWWEKYVYLSNRSPLLINSNYYGMDLVIENIHYHQSSRAANLVCASVAFKKLIEQETLKPFMINNVIPLCAIQYEQLFGTTRIPELSKSKDLATDILLNTPHVDYIVVLHNGCFYKVLLRHSNGKYLKPVEMEYMLNMILDDNIEVTDEEKYVPVFTSADRNYWAETRRDFFRFGKNHETIETIEKAAFVLVLETYPAEFTLDDGPNLNAYAKSLIAGDGYNRWFDKSFNLIVYSNGKAGFNAEHSWGDAPIMSHYWEYIMVEDAISPEYGYGSDGHCRGICYGNVPIPVRLKWSTSPVLTERMQICMDEFNTMKNNLDLIIVVFTDFGKGSIKKCRISPDGFIQMALQYTYFKIHKEFCLTYESSMSRLFKEGRTETIRSCSSKSCRFVKSLMDPSASDEEKVSLFREAVEYHSNLGKDAMTGKGIDRHLFTLYITAEMFKINDPFLKQVISQPWQLSTSQTPNGQSGLIDYERFPHFSSCGGGFGPVNDKGYGVSYIIIGEKKIFFHISSKHSCPATSSPVFADELRKSMKYLLHLLEKTRP